MDTKQSAIAKTETPVQVLNNGKKNVEVVLSSLAKIKQAEKNYLYIKSKIGELESLTFLDNHQNQQLTLVDAEGNRFNTNNASILKSVKEMMIGQAEQVKNEVEIILLSASLA